jgi:hypothetical protein
MSPFSSLTAKIFGGLAVVLLVVTAVQTVRVERLKHAVSVLRIDLSKVKAERDAERANHKATKDAYRAAQAEAERLEAERLARIQAKQKEVNDALRNDYNSRIAAVRLRAKAGAGADGAADCEPVPGNADAAPGITSAPLDCGLSQDERLIATEQAIRLEELQRWVTEQAKVSIH